MALGRFFRKESAPPPEAEESPVADETALDEAAEEDDTELERPESEVDAAEVEQSWRDRARDAIPGASSTGSKRPAALYGEGNVDGPTHFVRASGCTVVTAGGTELLDCTMALGAVSIGYADEAVTRAAIMAAAAGNVSGLAHTSEVEIAERLAEIIPIAEGVRFLKSGADAMSAAVRIARTATSRSGIVCCGYFGWHDWASTAKGIPNPVRADVHTVPFDDVAALESACASAAGDLAAIVLEPVIERLPSPEWIAAARRLADETGAVLVFDEMKTGFRIARGGFRETAGVEPDLAVFGKALSNGFPIAAVVGRAAIMDAAESTWISSTLAGESVALAAAGAVLDRYEQEDVCDQLASIGAQMRESLGNAIAASGVPGVAVQGIDPMWFLRFDDPAHERRFLEIAVGEGVLFKRGAYNYPALAHAEEEVLVEIERAASSAFVTLAEELSE